MIKIQHNRKRIKFVDLPNNECGLITWRDGEQSLVIKIPEVEDGRKRYNAYSLTLNSLCCVSLNTLVEKVDLEIKVL